MSLVEPRARETAAARRWLSIVGMGEDGVDGLTPIARSLVQAAEIVFGGQRHLTLAAPLIRGAARPWRSPFEEAIEEVLAQRGRDVCVLASGDPFVYGVGSVLLRHVDPRETVAFSVLSYSIHRHASAPVCITPLMSSQLGATLHFASDLGTRVRLTMPAPLDAA